jgi:hypothetical protein
VATKTQAKCKATKETKAQLKPQKAVPSSPPRPAPQSQAELADVTEQIVDPSDQGTSLSIASEQITAALTQGISSVITFQDFSTNEFANNPSLSLVLIDFCS